MTPQTPDQLAVCSWSLKAQSPADLVDRITQLGLCRVQLNLNPLTTDPGTWSNVKAQFDDAGLVIASGMFGCAGDDYSTPQTIRATGGVVPDHLWDDNWQIVQNATQQAQKLGLALVSTHIGFLPEQPSDPAYGKLVDRIGSIADHMAASGITLMFETGQETGQTLSTFLDNLGRDNVGVNFDPANMILYDMGEPIASMKKLMPRVVQCHVKDAVRTEHPDTWGTETPVGQGEVDWRVFLDVLSTGDFRGDLVIEREGGDNRDTDVRTAIEHLTALMT